MNNYKKKYHVLRLGILPWIYNKNNFFSCDYFSCDSRERERGFVFSIIVFSLFKNKVIQKYKNVEVRSKISSTMGISEKSYFRHIKTCLKMGLCVQEGNNLRFFSHLGVAKDIENKCYGENIKKYDRLHLHAADIPIKNRNFDYVKLLVRFVYIKYEEHRNLLSLNANIQRSKKRRFSRTKGSSKINSSKWYTHFESKSENSGKLIPTGAASSFKSIYDFTIPRIRHKEVRDLSKKFLLSNAMVSAQKNFAGDNMNEKMHSMLVEMGVNPIGQKNEPQEGIVEVLEHINWIQNSSELSGIKGNIKEIKEEVLDSLASRNGNINFVKRKSEGDGVEPSKPAVNNTFNRLNTSHLVKDAQFAPISKLGKILNDTILSPSDYFFTLCCDFQTEYRFGLSKMSMLLGISKSQCSRTMKSMEKMGIMNFKRRFVFMDIVEDEKPVELLNKIKASYSHIYDGQEWNPSQRLVFKNGCLLYEIESEKMDTVGIGMRNSHKYEHILEPTRKMERYGKLKRRLYG